MCELLSDLTDVRIGKTSTVELCDIRGVISAASAAALPASEGTPFKSGMTFRVAWKYLWSAPA
jgi:hypothetical protein